MRQWGAVVGCGSGVWQWGAAVGCSNGVRQRHVATRVWLVVLIPKPSTTTPTTNNPDRQQPRPPTTPTTNNPDHQQPRPPTTPTTNNPDHRQPRPPTTPTTYSEAAAVGCGSGVWQWGAAVGCGGGVRQWGVAVGCGSGVWQWGAAVGAAKTCGFKGVVGCTRPPHLNVARVQTFREARTGTRCRPSVSDQPATLLQQSCACV